MRPGNTFRSRGKACQPITRSDPVPRWSWHHRHYRRNICLMFARSALLPVIYEKSLLRLGEKGLEAFGIGTLICMILPTMYRYGNHALRLNATTRVTLSCYSVV